MGGTGYSIKLGRDGLGRKRCHGRLGGGGTGSRAGAKGPPGRSRSVAILGTIFPPGDFEFTLQINVGARPVGRGVGHHFSRGPVDAEGAAFRLARDYWDTGFGRSLREKGFRSAKKGGEKRDDAQTEREQDPGGKHKGV